MLRIACLAVMVFIGSGVGAFAQGTYVSASLFADIVRSTHTENGGFIAPAAGGEALGFALRAGTPLGAIWGVELEFARPGEIEGDSDSQPLALGQTTLSYSFMDGVTVPIRSPIAPPLFYEVRTRQRNSTLSAALWVQQQLSGRVAMVYLGGVGFHRAEQEVELTYAPLVGVFPTDLFNPLSVRNRTVFYGVQPLVGVESRISLTDHVNLVPGIRLHGADGGWLIRPAVGLGWMF